VPGQLPRPECLSSYPVQLPCPATLSSYHGQSACPATLDRRERPRARALAPTRARAHARSHPHMSRRAPTHARSRAHTRGTRPARGNAPNGEIHPPARSQKGTRPSGKCARQGNAPVREMRPSGKCARQGNARAPAPGKYAYDGEINPNGGQIKTPPILGGVGGQAAFISAR
jgi:hypothetical protein